MAAEIKDKADLSKEVRGQSENEMGVQPYDPEDGEDVRCGLGGCKPSWMQVFNNPKAALVWLCWFSFLQGKHPLILSNYLK